MAADVLLPALILLLCGCALGKNIDLYTLLQQGVQDGLRLLYRIFPALLVLLCALSALRSCGALAWLTRLLKPFCTLFGIPPETAPLILLRPFSGSAALAVFTDLAKTYGVSSRIGRTAAIMLGSTETTFYTISVYFGAAKIQKTRHTVFCALLADCTGFLVAALTAQLL